MRLVGIRGRLTGTTFTLGDEALTLGRGARNQVVLSTPLASRAHAELRRENGGWTLFDGGSTNGTSVNGQQVSSHRLRPDDEIVIGDEAFRFEDGRGPLLPEEATILVRNEPPPRPVLRVTVSGGGPVGLTFALLLDDLMRDRAEITVYDGRWTRDASGTGDGDDPAGTVVWQAKGRGASRRQQVVTVQSRQWSKLPAEIQGRLFGADGHTEMWPTGPDSVEDLPPRNIRIAYIEDQLLALANERAQAGRIRLVPHSFHADEEEDLDQQHVLAICEGGRSRSRDHFADRFGAADTSMYAVGGRHLQDVVLGLRVKSDLPDPMAVLLTVVQNRFLLNSLRGEGFLNMRLTEAEAAEAVGIDPIRQVFAECIQSQPCLMERKPDGSFSCSTHDTFFLPALLKQSPFWGRVEEGLRMFGVKEENLTAVTCFKLDMVQRPRFTAQLFPRTAKTPGTFGFLLGDAGNAIHFWPGRGLNSGLASALSLARNLATWSGKPLRDADFVRHEALMAMLQYRHKSRAWRQMVTTDDAGHPVAIKDRIQQGINSAVLDPPDARADLDALMERLRRTRARLEARLPGLPDDAALRAHLERLSPATIHTLLVSDAWDSGSVGGEEVDVDWLLAPVPERAMAGSTL